VRNTTASEVSTLMRFYLRTSLQRIWVFALGRRRAGRRL